MYRLLLTIDSTALIVPILSWKTFMMHYTELYFFESNKFMRLPAEYKLIEWIQDKCNKNKPIPQNLIPNPNTVFHAIGELQASPLHYWIVYRQHEPIPQCLLYHQTLYMSEYR